MRQGGLKRALLGYDDLIIVCISGRMVVTADDATGRNKLRCIKPVIRRTFGDRHRKRDRDTVRAIHFNRA